ncbi:MAG: YncE family protein [Candidatus Sulfotelmatobacter sp.]
MSLRCMGRLMAVLALIVIEMACGDYYRPVVIPLSTTLPTPSSQHTVFALTANAPGNPGAGMQIDVSGDTDVGEAHIDLPTHAAVAPNQSRLFIASAGSLAPGGADKVLFLLPSSILGGGLTLINTISMPSGSLPDYVATTQSGFVYVANFGTNNVNAINTTTNQLGDPVPVGTNPVAMAETPDTNKLYVANQGGNSVTSLNTKDLSQNPVSGFSGITPVWVVARTDSQKVYILTQGDGQLVTIDTATDTVTSSLPVGGGANFMSYDRHLNRLYVTNPMTANVYVFSATGGPNDTPNPVPLAVFSLAAGANSPCPAGCLPASVAALPDGSRFYVASYQIATTCPDPTVTGSCVIPQLTVFDAQSLTVKIASVPLLSDSSFAAKQFAVPPVASCVANTPYTPGTTRFRVFTTAAADSSRVYVSMCDAGAIAIINTTDSNVNNPVNGKPPDSLVLDLPAPVGACVQPSCSNVSSITTFSITSNVVTFQAANSFSPGQRVSISGLSTGTYLNGHTLTVLATGLSGGQFACDFTHADVGPTSDSGTAVPLGPAQAPVFLLTGQ